MFYPTYPRTLLFFCRSLYIRLWYNLKRGSVTDARGLLVLTLHHVTSDLYGLFT